MIFHNPIIYVGHAVIYVVLYQKQICKESCTAVWPVPAMLGFVHANTVSSLYKTGIVS
jgi:hypothetical protein